MATAVAAVEGLVNEVQFSNQIIYIVCVCVCVQLSLSQPIILETCCAFLMLKDLCERVHIIR